MQNRLHDFSAKRYPVGDGKAKELGPFRSSFFLGQPRSRRRATISGMENEKPYDLHDDPHRTFPDPNDPRHCRYIVIRRCDHSRAGFIHQTTSDGDWKLQDANGKDFEQIPTIESLDEAAMFLYMHGRCCQTTVEVNKKRIRVSPNFGQCATCKWGQWVASLLKDGQPWGTRCGASIPDAKMAGVRLAYSPNAMTEEEARIELDGLDWEDITDPVSA
jgi:hypothetical protein